MFRLLLLLFLLGASALAPASAQTVVAPEGTTRAGVRFDGQLLFELRGVSSLPASERAEGIIARIRAAAEDPTFDPAELTLEPVASGVRIGSTTHTILTIYDADARLEDIETLILASAIRGRIVRAIEAYRADRTPEGIGRALRTAGLWTLLWLGSLAVLVVLSRTSRRMIERYVDVRIEIWEQRARNVLRLKNIWHFVRGALRVGFVLLGAVATYVWLNAVMLALPWTRETGREALAVVAAPFRRIVTGFLSAIPDLIAVAIIGALAVVVLRVAGRFFDLVAAGSLRLKSFEPEWAAPTERLARVVIVLFAAIVAYPYIPGSSTEAFRAVGIFAGVMFSLGATSIVANLIAGYSLIYRRAFRVGDRIEVAGVEGDVEELTVQATYLRTVKNERVVVPNGLVLSSQVMNYSELARDRGLILHTDVGIGYEVPWREVEAMLLEAARRTPGALAHPEPCVLQKKLGDYSPVYEVNIYTRDEKRMAETYTALHANIQDVFAERGIQIMTPSYVADPPEPKVPPAAQSPDAITTA